MAPAAELRAVAVRVVPLLLLALLAVSGTGARLLARSLPLHGVATAVDAFVAPWSLLFFLPVSSPCRFSLVERPSSSVQLSSCERAVSQNLVSFFFLNLFSTRKMR